MGLPWPFGFVMIIPQKFSIAQRTFVSSYTVPLGGPYWAAACGAAGGGGGDCGLGDMFHAHSVNTTCPISGPDCRMAPTMSVMEEGHWEVTWKSRSMSF